MTENQLKYGDKRNDIITLQYQMSKQAFIGFIFGNILKYLRRYISISEKGNNPKDIEKVKDYIQRYAEYYDDVDWMYVMISIDAKEYKLAFDKVIEIEQTLLMPKYC
jgi:hypothetical protein